MEEKEVLTPEAKAIEDGIKASEAKPDKKKTFDDVSASMLTELYEMDRKEFRTGMRKYNDITQEKLKKERSIYQKKKSDYYRAMNRPLTGQDLQYIITQMKGVLQAVDLTKADADNLSATLIRKGTLTQKDLDETDSILKKEAAEKVELKKVVEKK